MLPGNHSEPPEDRCWGEKAGLGIERIRGSVTIAHNPGKKNPA
jgi:hypothetical protein